MAATFLASGSACAATEVMSQAAGDGRANVLLALPAIALGWVSFLEFPNTVLQDCSSASKCMHLFLKR